VDQGVSYGAGNVEDDAVDRAIEFLMAMAGQHGVHSMSLEKINVLLPLIHREVEVVIRLINIFSNYGAVQEDKGVSAILGRGKLFFQPSPLFILSLFCTVHYAVGIYADERTILCLE
jgi:hypothetical protein